MYSVITDTSANLPTALLKEKNISVLPFTFHMQDGDHICTDTEGFDAREFYQRMRDGEEINTSQVTPMTYEEYMTPILERGEDILFVGMSSGVSGSYNSAEMAAKTLRERFPGRTIRLVDTLGASLGEGLLVLKGTQCRDEGMSLEDTADLLLDLRHDMCQVFTVEDLRYLSRTGRISNVTAVLGNVLHIKPILKGNDQGKIVRIAQTRGRKAAVRELAKSYFQWVDRDQPQTIGIAHADCQEDAEWLANLLRQSGLPPQDIMTVVYEPVTGSHVGPGTLALFFMGNREFRK